MKTYLVGGAVRDAHLGWPVHERDWVVVGATPEALLKQGFKQVGASFPVFLHPKTGEEHALARTERQTGSGHQGFVCHFDPSVTLEDDLKRRDLTINAMAWDESTQTLIDPYGGLSDLKAHVLRHVSEAFVEDPLRVLRVARFATHLASLSFKVAPETEQLLQRMCRDRLLDTLSPERVWRETEKVLSKPESAHYFRLLDAWGGLTPWFAEIQKAPLWHQTLDQHKQNTPITRWALACVVGLADAEAIQHLNERLKTPKTWGRSALALLKAQAHWAASTLEEQEALLRVLDVRRETTLWPVYVEAFQALGKTQAAAVLQAVAAERTELLKLSAEEREGAQGSELQQRWWEKLRRWLKARG